MKLCAVTLVLVLAAGTAGAQPGTVEPVPPPVTFIAPQQAQAPRSESTALWLSLGGTLGSYALWFGAAAYSSDISGESARRLLNTAGSVGVVGSLLAPSFGHWYAGKGFTRGFGLRLGGIGVGILGAVVALSGCTLFDGGHDDTADPDCGNGVPAGIALVLLAGGMWVGGTVDDIVQAPRRVRRRNAAQVAVTPLLQGDRAGLALVGAF